MENVPNHYKDPGSLLNNQYNGKEEGFFRGSIAVSTAGAAVNHGWKGSLTGCHVMFTCRFWLAQNLPFMICPIGQCGVQNVGMVHGYAWMFHRKQKTWSCKVYDPSKNDEKNDLGGGIIHDYTILYFLLSGLVCIQSTAY